MKYSDQTEMPVKGTKTTTTTTTTLSADKLKWLAEQ